MDKHWIFLKLDRNLQKNEVKLVAINKNQKQKLKPVTVKVTNMGQVKSMLSKSKNKKNRITADPVNECCICYDNYTCSIPLSCGHLVHPECVTRWWIKNSAGGLRCPMCRSNSYGCYIEFSDPDRLPIGYYRHDNESSRIIMIRRCEYNGDSKYVKLPEISSREIALAGFIIYFETHYQAEMYTNLA